MQRESFQSRLGFILVSAGCAIGIGNVWKFPYVAGQNGGGVFVLFYLLSLVLMGIPVLTMELEEMTLENIFLSLTDGEGTVSDEAQAEEDAQEEEQEDTEV